MKKKFLFFLLTLLVVISGTFLVGCDMGTGEPKIPDYNADIQVVVPENIDTEHFVPNEDETYYTSSRLSLWMEVNGEFLKVNYFSLDGSRRVYDNLYLYEDDYFYMLSDDMRGWYATLSDSDDSEYAEEELAEGEEYSINIIKEGIYTVIFDTETLKFDLVYKSEITMPVYYTIKNCSIYSVATSWVEMSVNPANADEFVINNFNVTAGKIISFYNNLHTSNYKVTLEDSANNKLASSIKTNVTVNVGGNYNIYINRKTYVVRMELINPDTATYGCVYYDGTEFITLQPYETDVPYIFHYQITVDKYDNLPDFHSANYRTYDLIVVDTTNVLMGSGSNHYFKNKGTYNLIINLKTFEITVESLPE